MKSARFDPTAPLIIVRGRVWGPLRDHRVRLALDTGSGEVTIAPEIADAIGYSPRDGEAITRIRSAVGEGPGYFLRVRRFGALGLLGLSFLRSLNHEIRSAEGLIRYERA